MILEISFPINFLRRISRFLPFWFIKSQSRHWDWPPWERDVQYWLKWNSAGHHHHSCYHHYQSYNHHYHLVLQVKLSTNPKSPSRYELSLGTRWKWRSTQQLKGERYSRESQETCTTLYPTSPIPHNYMLYILHTISFPNKLNLHLMKMIQSCLKKMWVCLQPPLDVVPGHPLGLRLHLLDLDVLAEQQTVGHGSEPEVVDVMPGIN